MLILTRKPGESIFIGGDIKVTIVEIKGHQIRVGIDAPSELRIYREEIYLQILEENQRAAEAAMGGAGGLEDLAAQWQGRSGTASKLGGTKIGSLSSGSAPSVKPLTPTKSTASPQVIIRKKKGGTSDE